LTIIIYNFKTFFVSYSLPIHHQSHDTSTRPNGPQN